MLELKSITKEFPGVKALDGVSLRFEPGEIHALVGENGAGKSTAMKIITGIYQPDAGEILYQGRPLHFRNYRDSLRMGIDIVHQEIQVIPQSSVAENIMLDKLPTYGSTGIVNWKILYQTARQFMDKVGLSIHPSTPMKFLSAAQKQLAQIAKALAADAQVLLLDEPTSSLTQHEAEKLFVLLRRLKSAGKTLAFVSHKFEEIFALCDCASVLRDGRCVGTSRIAELTPDSLTRMMIGREFQLKQLGMSSVDGGREVLRTENIVRKTKAAGSSFKLHEGEILGFYGLVGSGRSELARILIGADQLDSGSIFIRGNQVNIRSVRESLHRHGIGYVTENRKEEGLLLKSSIQTNITLTSLGKLTSRFTRGIDPGKERSLSERMVRELNIRTPGIHQKVEKLSGGNQQKVSLAKWLSRDCGILIIDEPTVGVDIGAKEQIHQIIWNLANVQRKAVIVISSDMPEIIRLASRILVFRDQRIVGEVRDVDSADRTLDEVSAAIGKLLLQQ
jgi:ribose transport system ATP-binding protein